ncbi:MAG: hypothetical protein QXI59_08265 [Candidatus Bathyarchaeia archaeon]
MSELVIEGYGISLDSRKGYLYLRTHNGEESLIPPSNLTGVLITGQNIRLSVKSLITLSRFGVEVKRRASCIINHDTDNVQIYPLTLASYSLRISIEKLQIGERIKEGEGFYVI